MRAVLFGRPRPSLLSSLLSFLSRLHLVFRPLATADDKMDICVDTEVWSYSFPWLETRINAVVRPSKVRFLQASNVDKSRSNRKSQVEAAR